MTHTTPATLAEIRPRAVLEDEWSRATLESILAATPEHPAPRRRRLRTVVAGSVAFVAVGVGAAGAVGAHAFVDAFRDWRSLSAGSGPAVDPATAQRVATADGPGGTVFSLVAAHGRPGYACVAVLFETPASAAGAVPSDFVDANGSQCDEVPGTEARFGGMPAEDVQRLPAELGQPDVRVVSLDAGPAVRAVLRTTDGEARPLLRYEGRFYGWYVGHGDATPAPVVTGYAADGGTVGTVRP